MPLGIQITLPLGIEVALVVIAVLFALHGIRRTMQMKDWSEFRHFSAWSGFWLGLAIAVYFIYPKT